MSKSAFGPFPSRHRVVIGSSVNGKPYMRRSWFDIQEEPCTRYSWAFWEAVEMSEYQAQQFRRDYYWRQEARKLMPGVAKSIYGSPLFRKTFWLNGERKWGRP